MEKMENEGVVKKIPVYMSEFNKRRHG